MSSFPPFLRRYYLPAEYVVLSEVYVEYRSLRLRRVKSSFPPFLRRYSSTEYVEYVSLRLRRGVSSFPPFLRRYYLSAEYAVFSTEYVEYVSLRLRRVSS